PRAGFGAKRSETSADTGLAKASVQRPHVWGTVALIWPITSTSSPSFVTRSGRRSRCQAGSAYGDAAYAVSSIERPSSGSSATRMIMCNYLQTKEIFVEPAQYIGGEMPSQGILPPKTALLGSVHVERLQDRRAPGPAHRDARPHRRRDRPAAGHGGRPF